MIEVKNLKKSFSDRNILIDISFSIPHGQIVTIVGKSGAGKSVLLKCLIGLIKPDKGTIYLDNKLINSMNFQQLQKIRSQIGMVFQFGALFDSLNVGENIGLALRKLTKLDDSQIKLRIKNSLESVDMADTEELMPGELSGGMKKRVGIARAIAIDPEYILYDEPTTGLDPITTDKINHLIKNITFNKNQTSIIVTHEMKIVNETVNKVFMLYEGNIIFEGSPEELYSSTDRYIKYFTTGKKEI